jgi:hypothetical protein
MKRFLWLGLCALALAVAVPAGASTFIGLSTHELVASSNAVIQGEVLQVHSFWSKSGRIIVTEAIVRVTETVAGKSPSVVILRTFGGTVEGYTVEAHGFPTFRKGQELLLFVSNQADGTAEVTGYRQGQYRIVRDKAGVQVAVPTMENGVRLVTRDGRVAARPQALRLDTFKSQIQAGARRAGLNDN